MRSFRRLGLGELPYSRVLVISPHPDDSVLGCGGLVFKLTSHPQTRSRVKVTIFSMTPGYHGVDADFFREHQAAGREMLTCWPGLATSEFEDDSQLMAAVKEKLGNDFDRFGTSDDDDRKKLDNVIKAAIRCGESRRELDALGLTEPSALRFLALPRLYTKCIYPEELVRFRRELNDAADPEACNLLLVPHPDDPQLAHQAVTEAALRALDPAYEWHIWYYPSPWYRIPPTAIDVIVPLNDEELYRKRAAAETHRSQTVRTPYGKFVMSVAGLNADVLPELLLGFGSRRPHAFGRNCEVFQMRMRPFYACDPAQTDLLVCSDERLPMDEEIVPGDDLRWTVSDHH